MGKQVTVACKTLDQQVSRRVAVERPGIRDSQNGDGERRHIAYGEEYKIADLLVNTLQ